MVILIFVLIKCEIRVYIFDELFRKIVKISNIR